MAKGVDIELAPLDEDHVRAKITWSEQDVGGGKLVIEVTVKSTKTRPKTDDQLKCGVATGGKGRGLCGGGGGGARRRWMSSLGQGLLFRGFVRGVVFRFVRGSGLVSSCWGGESGPGG